jgi:hypothetical protein
MRLSNRLRKLEARASIDESSLSTIEQSWMMLGLRSLFAWHRHHEGTGDLAELTLAEANVAEFGRKHAAELAIIRARPIPPNPEFDALVANIERRQRELGADNPPAFT